MFVLLTKIYFALYFQVWKEKHSFGLIYHGTCVWFCQRVCQLLHCVCSAEICHWLGTDRNQYHLNSSQ